MKFTDEELSLIMDAHESGQLERRGSIEDGTCCMLMAAYGADDKCDKGWNFVRWQKQSRIDINAPMWWFDEHYEPTWTTDEFLRQLEAQGWA